MFTQKEVNNISLYATTLLKASGYGGLGLKPFEVFRFIKDMHKIRNLVLHGRIDEVIGGGSKNQLPTEYQQV